MRLVVGWQPPVFFAPLQTLAVRVWERLERPEHAERVRRATF